MHAQVQSGESRENGRSQLRLASVVGEIEGLWTAWLRARGPGRRQRLLAELGQAGARLAAEAAHAAQAQRRVPGAPTPLPRQLPRTRRNRRLVAARRGAEWITGRFSD
jgi:hypothetical protein